MSWSCPLREKRKARFLFWKYEVAMPHEWEILEIGVHMTYVSDTFKVSRKCKHCGKWEMKHFVEHEELLALGYSKEEIEKALHNAI